MHHLIGKSTLAECARVSQRQMDTPMYADVDQSRNPAGAQQWRKPGYTNQGSQLPRIQETERPALGGFIGLTIHWLLSSCSHGNTHTKAVQNSPLDIQDPPNEHLRSSNKTEISPPTELKQPWPFSTSQISNSTGELHFSFILSPQKRS